MKYGEDERELATYWWGLVHEAEPRLWEYFCGLLSWHFHRTGSPLQPSQIVDDHLIGRDLARVRTIDEAIAITRRHVGDLATLWGESPVPPPPLLVAEQVATDFEKKLEASTLREYLQIYRTGHDGKDPPPVELTSMKAAATAAAREHRAATEQPGRHSPVDTWNVADQTFVTPGAGGVYGRRSREPVRLPALPPGPAPKPMTGPRRHRGRPRRDRGGVEAIVLAIVHQHRGLNLRQLRVLTAPRGRDMLSFGLAKKAIEALKRKGSIEQVGRFFFPRPRSA